MKSNMNKPWKFRVKIDLAAAKEEGTRRKISDKFYERQVGLGIFRSGIQKVTFKINSFKPSPYEG